MRQTTPSLTVVAAVITDGDRILACRRAAGSTAAGKWEFPGGKVENGEAPELALAREIREELGVEIAVGALIDRSTTRAGDVAIDLSCYAARLTGETPQSSTDHDSLRWLLPHDLPELDWAEPDIPAVRILSRAAPADAAAVPQAGI